MFTLLKSTLSTQGGAEKYAKELAIAFAKRFGNITLLTSGPPPPPIPNVHIVTYTPKSSLSFKKVQEYDAFCMSYLKKNPSSYIFSLDRNSEQTHMRASNGVHASYLYKRKHYDPFWKQLIHKYNPLHTQILKIEKTGFESPLVEKIFTNSHMVAKEIVEYYNTPMEKIHVVHNGVEWHKLQTPFDATTYHRAHTCQLLFVGNGYRRKGLLFLLKALHLLQDKPFHLHIVGKEKNEKWFIHHTHNLGLTGKVTFYGAQKNLIPFYQRADIMIIPSFYDPFANVTLEALAMGVFVVSSTHNGAAEILTPSLGIPFALNNTEKGLADILSPLLQTRKTATSAHAIRASVRSFDFSLQLEPLIAL